MAGALFDLNRSRHWLAPRIQPLTMMGYVRSARHSAWSESMWKGKRASVWTLPAVIYMIGIGLNTMTLPFSPPTISPCTLSRRSS